MTYWHLQMSQPWGRNNIRIESKSLLMEQPPIIGTGEWDDIQCRMFTGEDSRGIKLNDIVLIREGNRPIALCQVRGDSFKNNKLEGKFHHVNFREVKVLFYYEGEGIFPKLEGTLERLINKSSVSYKFIDSLFKNHFKIKKMHKYVELLKYKKQIILQGPPGTGKTKLAKELAREIIGIQG